MAGRIAAGAAGHRHLDNELIQRGLIAAPKPPQRRRRRGGRGRSLRRAAADLRREIVPALRSAFPDACDLQVQGVWAANPLLRDYAGNFNLYVKSRDLTKQEGLIFRHLLRLILLCGEFATLTPPDGDAEAWLIFLRDDESIDRDLPRRRSAQHG